MRNFYQKLSIFLCLIALFVFNQSKAQGVLSGQVLDENNQTIIGAVIAVEGTANATSSDINGKYALKLAAGNYEITASFVGYAKNKQKVVITEGKTTNVSFKMQPTSQQLKEVVVVGYGTQTKREITGAVSQVKAKDLENVPSPSFDAMLQGRAPGIQVSQSNGAPGSATRVRIRGQASVTGSSDPLYVVDGVPLNNQDFSAKNYGTTSAIALNPLAQINPDDIESIDILKDASAAAIYGARAANGVIIITTKKGKSGKASFNFNYSVGFNEAAHRIKMLDGNQWKSLVMEAYRNDSNARVATGNNTPLPFNLNMPISEIAIRGGSIADRQRFFWDSLPNNNTDWIGELLQRGWNQNISLSASGGNDKTTYFMSGGYNKSEGFLKGNTFQRYSFRTNLENRASKNLTIGTQIGQYYTINDQVRTSYNGGLGTAQGAALPFLPVQNADGSYWGTQIRINGIAAANTALNPVAQMEDKFQTTNWRSLTNLYLSYNFAKNFVFRTEGGIEMMDQREFNFFSPVNRYFRSNMPAFRNLGTIGLGSVSERRVFFTNFNTNNTLTWSKTIKENHKITVLGGMSAQNVNQKDIGYDVNGSAGFLDPYFNRATANISWHPGTDTTLLKSGLSPINGYNSFDFYRFVSYFARVNYQLKDRYILQVSARRDGSSRFGPNNRFGFFPSVGLNWIASDESFLKNIEDLSYLKVRASYGLTGNSEIGNFTWLGSYSQNGNYLGQFGYAPSRLPNPNLSWEENRQFDLGIEFGLFNSRITGGIGYYRKMGSRLLIESAVQQSATGFERLFINSNAKVLNSGLEFNITTQNLTGKLRWTTDFNYAYIHNKVVNADGIQPDALDVGPGDARFLEGYAVGTSFLAEFLGIDPNTGWEKISVINPDGSKGEALLAPNAQPNLVRNNRKPMGRPFPWALGGINNSFGYKGFELSFLVVYSLGNTIYDDGGKYQLGAFQAYGPSGLAMANQRADVLERWQKPGDETTIPKLTLTPFSPDNNNTSRFLYDGSFIRMRTLQFSYNLPKKVSDRLKVNNFKIYLAAQNPFMIWTKFKGWDPEVVRYADGGTGTVRNSQSNVNFGAPYFPTPQMRSVNLGVNINF